MGTYLKVDTTGTIRFDAAYAGGRTQVWGGVVRRGRRTSAQRRRPPHPPDLGLVDLLGVGAGGLTSAGLALRGLALAGTRARALASGFAADAGTSALVDVVGGNARPGQILTNAAISGASGGLATRRGAAGGYGLAPQDAITALPLTRLQHGTRHLTDSRLLPPWQGATSPQLAREFLTPILERPLVTFDHTLGGTPVKGFLGEANGRVVAVFIFESGPLKGQLATSYLPSPGQLAKWGI